MPVSSGRSRSTAGQRRAAIVVAAIEAFADTGYHGTSVHTIAKAAGISEAYVFRLFGDKQGLFVAALRGCFERVREAIRLGADRVGTSSQSPSKILDAMAVAYADLMGERELLMFQLHALTVGNDPVIREELLAAQRDLVIYVQTRSGASDSAVQEFLARGQLCHFVTALGLVDLRPGTRQAQEPWVQILTHGIRHVPPRPLRPS